MKKFLPDIKLWLWVCFIIPMCAYSQLDNFNLEIVTTNESCGGNGTMTFNVSNTIPGSDLLFTVYKQPNLTIPISSSSSEFLGSLTSGTYTVIALQTLGTDSGSIEQEVVIEQELIPLEYEIEVQTHLCSNSGTIIINIVNGTGVAYEIISGPVTVPLQDSNVFDGLPEGTYNIRVFNECGQGVVTTYTVFIEPEQPVVSPPILQGSISSDCDSVIIINSVSYPEGTVISYPLTVEYTIYPPNGDSPIVNSQTYNSGAPSLIEFSNEFQLYDDETFSYDLVITNSCGITYGSSGMSVNPSPTITYSLIPNPCGEQYLSVAVQGFTPPFSFDFFNGPVDFDASTYNLVYPGPFTTGEVIFGSEENTLPEGTYTVQITDGCNRVASTTIEIEPIELIPTVSVRNNGCFSEFGRIVVSVPDRDIISAVIISAPDTYSPALPHDVSSSVNSSGLLILTNLPLGTYTLTIIDECGNEYEVTAEVPVFVEQDFTISGLADCTENSGALSMVSGNGELVNVTILSAPASFPNTVPYHITEFISVDDGGLYMDGLPEGNYTLTGTDICGIQRTVQVTILSYSTSATPFTFIPNCNSFDIEMKDFTSGAINAPQYWLQRENPSVPGQWQHPLTGIVYNEGTLPDGSNSELLENNSTNFNLHYQGNFRIVKAFESAGNGVPVKLCFEILGEFYYFDSPQIDEVYNLACQDNPDDILINAIGLEPLQFRIVEKDGIPFFLDNGLSNIFTGLAPGVYKFEVEDDCGHITPRIVNINTLPNLVSATEPGDLHYCIDSGESVLQEFDLSQQTAVVLGEQSPGVYTVTYHRTQADADSGSNPLPELYTNITNPQTIFARVQHNFISVCDEVVSFDIGTSEYPVVVMEEKTFLCLNDTSVVLSAGTGFDSYMWSNGATTSSILVTEPGTYSVTVSDFFGDFLCSGAGQTTVISSESATDVVLETSDWTENQNSITVNASGTGDYEYSLDNSSFQEDPVFNGLETGVYTVYIRDINGCGTIEEEIWLLYYPNYFTPNGDGHHDKWRIEYSTMEPDMEIYIYDRFGKLITGFGPESEGWDGTLNGRQLPSTDYWFVVKRQDGRIHRGHFAMFR